MPTLVTTIKVNDAGFAAAIAGATAAADAAAASAAAAEAAAAGFDPDLYVQVAGGQTVIGPLTMNETLSMAGATPIVAESTVGNTVTLGTKVDNGNDTTLVIRKARGGAGAAAQITAGDDIGRISFRGYDGSTYQEAAFIQADSSASTGNLGGILSLGCNGQTVLNMFASGNAAFNSQLTVTGNLLGSSTISGDFIATQAEAEAGTVSNKVMTPERVAQAIAAGSNITTVTFSPPLAATAFSAHGLGGTPTKASWAFVCEVAQGNYAVGDKIFDFQYTKDFSNDSGHVFWYNATNAGYAMNSSFPIIDRTTTGLINIDPNSWRLEVYLEGPVT